MPVNTDNGMMFAYPATAENMLDLKIMADWCKTLPTYAKYEIEQHYEWNFSKGQSFTFVQYQDNAIAPLMDWIERGEDDEATFIYFTPKEERNPYCQLKVARITRGGQIYEFHIFYRDPTVITNPPALMKIMIELNVPVIVRDLIIFRSNAHAVLSNLYESNIAQEEVSRLDRYLQETLRLDPIKALPAYGDETRVAQVDKFYRFKKKLEVLRDECIQAIGRGDTGPAREVVYEKRDENGRAVEKLYDSCIS